MDPDLICYAFVDQTNEYVCPVEADRDPLDNTNILWPRNTTRVAPPNYPAGRIPVFNTMTKQWTVQPDFRGRYGYDPDGNPVLIMQAGDPSKFKPPLTTSPPTPSPPDGLPEPDPNLALRTSKVAFFRRCTEEEAAQFMADLTEASPRLKAIFDSVSYLIPGTDEYPQLRAAVEARVGATRADELLAPSND